MRALADSFKNLEQTTAGFKLKFFAMRQAENPLQLKTQNRLAAKLRKIVTN